MNHCFFLSISIQNTKANADINFEPVLNQNNIDNSSIYGKKSGNGVAIAFIDFVFRTKVTMAKWTRYPIYTLQYKATSTHGFAIDQDTGTVFVIEIDDASNIVYLKIEGTALPANKWLRGQAVFMSW